MSAEPPAKEEEEVEWQGEKADEESEPPKQTGSKQGNGGRRNKGSEQWKWKGQDSNE